MVLETVLTLFHPDASAGLTPAKTYTFEGFISANEVVSPQDLIFEADTDDDQTVEPVRYKTQIDFQLWMHNASTISTVLHTGIGKVRLLARDVKRLTDSDSDWTATWFYFDDGTTALDTSSDLSAYYTGDYIGKIISFGWNADGESANNRVKCSFAIARTTQD